MLTNFATIRKAVKKMSSLDKLMSSPSFNNISKRERLQITRERAKLEKNLGSIAELSKLPSAVFVVDIMKEHIAVAEARKLNIPTFAIVDTNSDPNLVEFPIPANDDASKSIALVVKKMIEAIEEGLAERKLDRDKRTEDEQEEYDEHGVRISRNEAEDDEEGDEEGREAAHKKRVTTTEEGSEERAKRPRKVVARKPGGSGAPRKGR
jgi:small subunit ribosomal protein S2